MLGMHVKQTAYRLRHELRRSPNSCGVYGWESLGHGEDLENVGKCP